MKVYKQFSRVKWDHAYLTWSTYDLLKIPFSTLEVSAKDIFTNSPKLKTYNSGLDTDPNKWDTDRKLSVNIKCTKGPTLPYPTTKIYVEVELYSIDPSTSGENEIRNYWVRATGQPIDVSRSGFYKSEQLVTNRSISQDWEVSAILPFTTDWTNDFVDPVNSRGSSPSNLVLCVQVWCDNDFVIRNESRYHRNIITGLRLEELPDWIPISHSIKDDEEHSNYTIIVKDELSSSLNDPHKLLGSYFNQELHLYESGNDYPSVVVSNREYRENYFKVDYSNLLPNYEYRGLIINRNPITNTLVNSMKLLPSCNFTIKTKEDYPSIDKVTLLESSNKIEINIKYSSITEPKVKVKLSTLVDYETADVDHDTQSASYVITNLLPNTEYSIDIFIENTRGDTSKQVKTSTLSPDPFITSITLRDITNKSINVSVSTRAISPDTYVRYEYKVLNTWIPVTNKKFTISNLEPSTWYVLEVRGITSLNRVTNIRSERFKTKSNPPSKLKITSQVVTNTSARIYVDTYSQAGIRLYEFSLDGGNSYTLSSLSSSTLISDLNINNIYDLKVRVTDNEDNVVESEIYHLKLSRKFSKALPKVRFVRNITSQLESSPYTDGSVIVDTESNTLFTDIKVGDSTNRINLSSMTPTLKVSLFNNQYRVDTNFIKLPTNGLIVLLDIPSQSKSKLYWNPVDSNSQQYDIKKGGSPYSGNSELIICLFSDDIFHVIS